MCFKSKTAKDDSRKQSQTESTLHVDVSQVKQSTVDFVDGTFVLMKRKSKCYATSVNDTNKSGVTTTED